MNKLAAPVRHRFFPVTRLPATCALLVLCASGCIAEETAEEQPYGPGNGAISIWTDFNPGQQIDVSVDNTPAGKLTTYFKDGEPACGQPGTVQVVLPAGTYNTKAQAGTNYSWDSQFEIIENECTSYRLSVSNPKPNVPATVNGRPVEVQGTIYVKNQDVTFSVWDSGTIDGDIISLQVNGAWQVSRYTSEPSPLRSTRRATTTSSYTRTTREPSRRTRPPSASTTGPASRRSCCLPI